MSPKPDLRGIELRRRRRADGSVRVTYRVRAVALDGSRPGKTFTDVEAAIEERDRLDVIAARIAAGPPARASMTVTGLRDRWWNGHVLRELAPRTQNGYRHAWIELEPRIGDRLAISAARRDIKQLRIDVLDDGLGPGSVNYKLTMLHAIFPARPRGRPRGVQPRRGRAQVQAGQARDLAPADPVGHAHRAGPCTRDEGDGLADDRDDHLPRRALRPPPLGVAGAALVRLDR